LPRKVGTDQAELDAEEAEEQAGCGKRESGRIADQHEQNHAPEHQGRHVVAMKFIAAAFRMRIVVDDMLKRGDALDDLGDALQRIRPKPTGAAISPAAHKTAGVEEALVDVPGLQEPGPGEIDQDHARSG
jgi:hypothetical protein